MPGKASAAARLEAVEAQLSAALGSLSFRPPVAYVYNALEYAATPHRAYLRRWARSGVEAVFLGMNPGPFGMAQTGVPFGEVGLVRDFLGIDGPVGKPEREHPKRPVEGFACRRSEVSGQRLWGFVRDRFATPEAFFARFFVANYCPLLFLEEGGRNLTPDKLAAADREPLLAACDQALAETIAILSPRLVVGVGKFAEDRARSVLAGTGVPLGGILHPSPASPAANRDWAGVVVGQLKDLGIDL
ncbi:MAG TPA: uracil-DNA glycosylase family protein [Thermoanaerobaculia bacterium]|nr:uracil-DNA glycosylase family protein [Thermoanaerobaculia bacterium]